MSVRMPTTDRRVRTAAPVVGLLGLAGIGLLLAPLGVLVLGVTSGLVYGMLAVGLVLVFRSNRFVNFAHGQIGAFSAVLLAKAVIDWGWDYWAALPLALGLGVGIGAVFAVAVVRPLERAPRLVPTVATIGVVQVLVAISLLWGGLRPDANQLVVRGYPTPFSWQVSIGDVTLAGPQFMILVVVPTVTVLGALFLGSTSLGLAIRAVAVNEEAARLAGVSTRRVTLSLWAIVGGLSAITAILIAPSLGTYSVEVLGPGIMLRGLAAATLARMTSLPGALVAGLAVGIVELQVFWRYPAGGVTDLALLLVVLGAMLVQRRQRRAGAHEEVPLRFRTRPLRPITPAGVSLTRVAVGLAVVGALLLPLGRGQADTFSLTLVVIYAMVGLSLVVLVGWAGQLSLGQFAFVGVGAYAAAELNETNPSLPLALVVAAAVGAIVALAFGLPALRVRGLHLAVVTLGFAIAAKGWLFNLDGITGSQQIGPPRLAGEAVVGQRSLYYLALGTLVALTISLNALRASGPGRLILATRDNDRQVAAHGTAPAGVRLAAFALSGAIASVAGVFWAYANRNFDANSFPPQLSLALLAMVVIGGAGSTIGAITGAGIVFGIPVLLHASTSQSLLISGLGVVLVFTRLPGGVSSLLWAVRDRLTGRAAADPPGPPVPDQHQDGSAAGRFAEVVEMGSRPPVPARLRATRDTPSLRCADLSVTFGGVTALAGVDLTVQRGEVVGLIGANGAGKSTAMNVISGFVQPDEGTVELFGVDVTDLAPELRCYAGLGRGFQDATLYPGLTVLEAVLVALEPADRGGMISALTEAPWHRQSERRKTEHAKALIDAVGLAGVADLEVGSLSTGLRRVCDLATVLARTPELLLLDEPTAGLAQREVEAFVPMLSAVTGALGCAVLVIEHDMALVMALSDRIVAMETGKVIANGTPDQVRNDPRVVASYLGSADPVIARSTAAP